MPPWELCQVQGRAHKGTLQQEDSRSEGLNIQPYPNIKIILEHL